VRKEKERKEKELKETLKKKEKEDKKREKEKEKEREKKEKEEKKRHKKGDLSISIDDSPRDDDTALLSPTADSGDVNDYLIFDSFIQEFFKY
jgi:hypothetical protein